MMSKLFISQKSKITAGILALGLILIGIIVYSLQFFMDRLLVRDAYLSGMRWANHIENSIEDLDLVFWGNGSNLPISSSLEKISSIGQIYRYVFLDQKDDPVFSMGSYHPAEVDKPAEHHAHSHEEVSQPSKSLNTRGSETTIHDHETVERAEHTHNLQSVMTDTSHNRSFRATPVSADKDSSDEHHYHLVSHGRTDSTHKHLIDLRSGNGIDQPEHYAIINHPIFKDDHLVGTIRVFVDQTEKYGIFSQHPLLASLDSSLRVNLGVWYPLFLLLPRQGGSRSSDGKSRVSCSL